jgi:hypothetical protein
VTEGIADKTAFIGWEELAKLLKEDDRAGEIDELS